MVAQPLHPESNQCRQQALPVRGWAWRLGLEARICWGWGWGWSFSFCRRGTSEHTRKSTWVPWHWLAGHWPDLLTLKLAQQLSDAGLEGRE